MRKQKNKLLMLIGIMLIILLIAGSTYAWLTWQGKNTTKSGTSQCFDITYTNGTDINTSIDLVDTPLNGNTFTYKKGMANASVSILLDSNCNVNTDFTLTLNNTTVPSVFISGSSIGALKYALVDSSSVSEGNTYTVLASGDITSTGKINMHTTKLTAGTTKNYTVIVYADGNYANNDAIGAIYAGNISASGEQSSLPSGYTRLAYLESTGTQYIDTGYILTSNSERTYIDFEKTDVTTYTSLFGSEYPTGNRRFTIIPHGTSSLSIYVGTGGNISFPVTINTRYTLDLTASDLKISGTLVEVVTNTPTIKTGTYDVTYGNLSEVEPTICLFCNHTYSGFSQMTSAKIYSFKIWDNEKIVRNFVPVLDSNNVPGMYDVVNNIFYTNKGSGSFKYSL